MTVNELIDKLLEMNPNLDILMQTNQGVLYEIRDAVEVKLNDIKPRACILITKNAWREGVK